jgi:hydrogenase-4 component F
LVNLELLLPLTIAVPLVTALLGHLPLPWAERAHALGATVLLVVGGALALTVFGAGPLEWAHSLFADALSALLVAVVVVVGWGGAMYSIGYLRHDVHAGRLDKPQQRWFIQWYQLFIASMLATVLFENLGLMWAAIEATTLASAILVGLYRTREALEAAWKYILICTAGITFALFGVLLLYYSGVQTVGHHEATLDWRELMRAAPTLDHDLVRLAFVFALVGLGTKAGLAPLHTWLPDAHSQAPTPVSAVLSGVLLPCALYGIIRFHTVVSAAIGPEFSSNLLVGFGVLSAAVAVPFILIQRDLKRLLAYSSIEHIGLITAAIGFGGPIGWFAAMLHLAAHAVGKAMLFFVAGNIAAHYQTRTMSRIAGAARALPLSGVALLAGVLVLAGAPPSALFTSELGLLLAGVNRGYAPAAIALLACMALAFCGLLYHATRMVLGLPSIAVRRVESWAMGALLIVPLIALVGAGLWLPPSLVVALEGVAPIVGVAR